MRCGTRRLDEGRVVSYCKMKKGSLFNLQLLTGLAGGVSWVPFFACNWALILAAAAAIYGQPQTKNKPQRVITIPAAAAGSAEVDFRVESVVGLPGSRLRGLRVRVSDCRDGGDRERRSKRDGRRDSGSVWSKRERFGRRSLSAMTIYP